MALLAALGLYLATALALAVLTRRLAPEDGPGEDGPGGRGLSWTAAGLLALLPLLFTYGGFLPGKVLAPTNDLTLLAPWRDPELVARVEEGSTAPNLLLVDPIAQFLPWRRAARDDLLFNPAQGGGAALLGNGQSAVLFPTEIAARWLTPLRAVAYSQAARLALAAFGLFLLIRALGRSQPAALAGAAVYVGSGYLQLWRLHPHSLTAVVVPWIVWAALRLAHRPGPSTALALAVTGALGVAAGHAETLLHGVLLAGILAAVALARRVREVAERGGRSARALLRAAGWATVSAVLAFLLAAPVLLPFVDNLRVSAEWQRRAVSRAVGGGFPAEAPWSEALSQLAFAVTPWAYGDPRQVDSDGQPPGPNNAAELAGGAVGAAALLLALGAFARRRRAGGQDARAEPVDGERPSLAPAGLDPGNATWLAVALVGLLVGAQVPGISRLLAAVPVLSLSILGRLSLWAALALAVLAAAGVERLGPSRDVASRALLPALVVALPLLLVAVFRPGSRALPGVPLEALALGAALVALQLLGRKRSSRPALGLLVLALVLPRLIAFHGWIPVASSLSFYPDTLAVRRVQELRDEAPPAGWRVAGLNAAYLPHAAAFHGLEEARAYDPMTFGPYERFLEGLGKRPAQGGVQLFDPAQPGLAFLGVRWIFDHPSMSHRPGVDVVWAGRDAVVYENPDALPRIYVPQEVQIVADEGRALRTARRIDDFAHRVALQGRDLPPPGRYPNGAARVVEMEVEPGRLTARVEAEARAVIATSQPAIPGWRLTRDGEAFEPLRINGAFLGAAVGPGVSRLEWLYAPRSWRWGWGLFAVGLVAAVGIPLGFRRVQQ